MNPVDLLHAPLWKTLATVLLHSLWQGAALAAILLAALRLISARRTAWRYGLALGAMAAVLMSAFVTWGVLDWRPAAAARPAPVSAAVQEIHEVRDVRLAAPPPSASPAPAKANWVPWVAGAWLIGAAVMLARMIFSILGARQIRRAARPMADQAVADLFRDLRGRMKMFRAVRVAVSDRLTSPAVIGLVWPTLLLPVSFLSSVPPDLLRAVLAHELAHIRRCDYLVNLLQMLVEALFFFNPALWWISRQVRLEREACCDAAAVAAIGGAADYARLMAGCAESGRRGAVVSPAFAGDPPKGQLLERIRRVLRPEQRPVVRVPWYSLCIAMLAGALLLLALWQGSRSAVAAVGRILSHQERAEEIAATREKEGTFDIQNGMRAIQVEARGTVRTEDGAAVPEGAKVLGGCQTRGGGHAVSLRVQNGRISGNVVAGQVALRVDAPGYAPAYTEAKMVEAGAVFDFGEIILRKGFDGKVQFLDADGKPIPRVKVTGGTAFPVGGYTTDIHLESDERGVLTLPHCCARPYSLTVRMSGFQYDQKDLTLVADKPTPWVLQRAVPVAGRVVREEDGAPIEGAKLRLMYSEGRLRMQGWLDHADVVAVSDAAGRFVLDWLAGDTTYWFAVEAPGREIVFMRDVKAGNPETVVTLGPELVVSGTVVGPLDGLPVKDGKRMLKFIRPIRFRSTLSSEDSGSVPIEKRNGVNYFEIKRLFRGEMTIKAGTYKLKLDVQKSISDLVIDLDTPAAGPTRPVLIRVKTPPGVPQMEGKAAFSCTQRGSGREFKDQMEFHGGEAVLTLPAPSSLSTSFEIPGYWFPGGHYSYDVAGGAATEQLWELEAWPAGMIHGTIRDAAGKSMFANVETVVLEKPAAMKETLWLSPLFNENSSRYTINAPLGVKCVICAFSGIRLMASREVTLDETTPLVEQNFVMPDGVTVRGQALSPDGKPVPDAEIYLRYDVLPEKPITHKAESVKTDADGRFVLEHVNIAAPFDTFLMLSPARDYRAKPVRITPAANPMTLRLEKGEVLTGAVIYKDTGEPAAGVQVFARAEATAKAAFGEQLRADAVTDARGRFRFSNMEPVEYYLYVNNHNVYSQVIARGGAEDAVIVPVWR